MSEGKTKSEEMEPSFNIDDWMKELLPDSDLSAINGSETTNFHVSTSFMDNPMLQSKSIENCQVATTSNVSGNVTSLRSNIKSSMNRNSVNTSGCVFTDSLNNPVRGFSNTSSSANGLAHNQNLSHMIMQAGQHQQLHHQVHAQLVEMPNNYTSSTRPNAYNSSNQMEQQENLTASTMIQHQRSIGYQPSSRLSMQNQESFNVIQQADQSKLEPKLQKFSRHLHMQQSVNMQSGFVSEHVQPKLMASAFPQSQSRNFQLANQMKSEKQSQQLQGPPQVQMPIPDDWVNQAFNQIAQFKAVCFTDVMAYHKNATEQRNQAQNNETVAKLEKMMSIYRQILSFLQMSKSGIQNHGKDSFLKYMKYFGPHLQKIRAKNSLRMQQAQQIDASFSQLVTPQLRHRGIVPQLYGTLPNLPGTLRQQRPLSLDPSRPMSSFQVGSSAGVQMLDASSNRHSMKRSTQQHSPSQVPQKMAISSLHEGSKLGFEQRSPVNKPLSSSSVPRQFTFSAQQQKVTSPHKVINPLEVSSSEKINNPNIAKLAQRSLSIEHVPEKNSGSPLRHFVGLNKSSSSFNIPSPQNSQHSSSLLELSKSRTPPSLSTSPLTFPSSLNPLTPISKATDSEFSSLSLEESNKVQSASPPLVEPKKQKESVMEGLVSSPLVTEPPIPDKEDFSHDTQYPINRLINAVKTMSPIALQSSIQDIRAIVQMSDRIVGSFRHGEHTKNILNDLASHVRTHNDWNFFSMYETGKASNIKRQVDYIGVMSHMECHASDVVNRPRKKPNDELVLEIKEINKKLMEVVMEARAGHDEETSIVHCSYRPIGLDGNGIPNNSRNMFPYLVHELTVMDDYPHSSPIILDSKPPSCSESEEGKEMWMKAMSNFTSEVRILEHPISLQQMAIMWELCARDVYREFAEKNGGGDFSTTYGKWETLSC